MQKLENDMLLYHGSYCEVQNPDLTKCARYKDFGQGFYLTTSRNQAESFAKISLRKAIANGIVDEGRQYGIVSAFQCNNTERLSVKIYSMADETCISLLLPERLQDQFCFRTDEALQSLVFVESEQIWL